MKKIKILSALLLLAFVAAACDNKEDKVIKDQIEQNIVDDVPFKKTDNGGFEGTLTLTGYLDVKNRVCNEGDMCGKAVDYASFIFTETSSDDIYEFIGIQKGNNFVEQRAVGIGCLEKDKNRIFYENFSDKDKVQKDITGDDYTRLINSKPERPVQLRMTRPTYTSGQGAPDCYSHFRDFDVL
jgi:hypothetical protein